MLPLSLGLGEGGEQNAPIGRAVIGGLIFGDIGDDAFHLMEEELDWHEMAVGAESE